MVHHLTVFHGRLCCAREGAGWGRGRVVGVNPNVECRLAELTFHWVHLSLICTCKLEQKVVFILLFVTSFLRTKYKRTAIQQYKGIFFGRNIQSCQNDNVIKTKHWMPLKSNKKIRHMTFKNNPRIFKNNAWGKRHTAFKNNIKVLKHSAWSQKVLPLMTNTWRSEFNLQTRKCFYIFSV